MNHSPSRVRLALEVGNKKTFASALDWPGWCRAGKKTADAAIEELLEYRDRYNEVVVLAGIEPIGDEVKFEVVDRLPGDATTDFGVPAKVHAVEHEAVSEAECERQVALLQACWRHFDETAASVTPELRKGPRGGGRDRDGIVDHVIQADRTYARKIGVRTPPFDSFDGDTAIAHREAVYSSIPALRNGELAVGNGWPVRYAVRRMAWHVLDHAWEMEDKNLG